MISLHSCFVAGLTLVYCIWRDRTLFSYEVLEATHACSQILTIFGEKWPGAIKYRDIYDALSGSLLRLTVQPVNAKLSPIRAPTHGLSTAKEPRAVVQEAQSRQEIFVPLYPEHSQTDKPAMSYLVSDAVKEAFMEVDEEAPGGWQGWRMWNEMVKEDANHPPDPALGYGGDIQGLSNTSRSSNQYLGICGTDPIQDATVYVGNNDSMDDGQWAFDS